MRMKPVQVVLDAPPDCFAWGKNVTASDWPDCPDVTLPTAATDRNGKKTYHYNRHESKAIWCSAAAFRGEPPDTISATGDLVP